MKGVLNRIENLKESISEKNHSARLHCELADLYVSMSRWVPAISEYRTALALGVEDREQVEKSLEDARSRCGWLLGSTNDNKTNAKPLEALDPNRYYRLRTLADHIRSIVLSENSSVLDVGGGEGELGLLMPEKEYVLAEPSVNGIRGQHLSFPDDSFDIVVACHVLEHVPKNERKAFLISLCSKARAYVLLLNPFHRDDRLDRERLSLIYDITGVGWAKEHLECDLPKLEDLKSFAKEEIYGIRTFPNGDPVATTALVFGEYFVRCAGRSAQWSSISKFINTQYFDKMTNVNFPNGFLVEIDLRGRKGSSDGI